jgi:hypothetical protein
MDSHRWSAILEWIVLDQRNLDKCGESLQVLYLVT